MFPRHGIPSIALTSAGFQSPWVTLSLLSNLIKITNWYSKVCLEAYLLGKEAIASPISPQFPSGKMPAVASPKERTTPWQVLTKAIPPALSSAPQSQDHSRRAISIQVLIQAQMSTFSASQLKSRLVAISACIKQRSTIRVPDSLEVVNLMYMVCSSRNTTQTLACPNGCNQLDWRQASLATPSAFSADRGSSAKSLKIVDDFSVTR